MYALYLGSSNGQVVFPLTAAQHTAHHSYLESLGFQTHNGDYVKGAQQGWDSLTDKERRAITIESMRRAGIPESLIDQHIDSVMSADSPGISQKRRYGDKVCASTAEMDKIRADDLDIAGWEIWQVEMGGGDADLEVGSRGGVEHDILGIDTS